MRLLRLCAFGVLAIAASACSKDTDGTITDPGPLAGLRYVNLVPDTAPVDFRVMDIVGNAPNQVAAAFRSGGLPSGVTTTLLPPHQAVRAGTRTIVVFRNGTTPAVASDTIYSTTFDFVANTNYTMYLHGNASGAAPALTATIVADNPGAIAAGRWALRVINLATTLASAVNPATSPTATVDVNVAMANTAVGGAATAGLTNLAFGGASGYVQIDTNTSATVPYRLVGLENTTTTPHLFASTLPIGARGNATTNPIAGTYVVGTAITAVIVPRSAPGTSAPQTVPANVTTNIDSITVAAGVATVWRRITPGNGTSTCNSAVAAGVALGDAIIITGMTAPELNGHHVVSAVTAGTSQTVATPFACNGTATSSRFSFPVTGAPASPAAGTPAYRIVASGFNVGLDYSVPSVIYLIDQQPALTAP